MIRDAANIAKCAAREAMSDNITGEGAKAAYYCFLSFFPLILAAFAFAGIVGGPEMFETLMAWIRSSVPAKAADALSAVVAEITLNQKPGALSLGIVMTIWSASNFFSALADGLDAMFDVKGTSFIRKKLKSLVMMFTGGAVLIAGGILIVAGPAIFDRLGIGIVMTVLRWPLVFTLITAVFFLLYYILPDRDQSDVRKQLLIGAVAGAVIWIIATAAFRFYAGNISDYGKAYGPIGGVIVMLLWLYLTALAILFGGEVGDVLTHGMPGRAGHTEHDTRRNTRAATLPTQERESMDDMKDDAMTQLPPNPTAARALPPGHEGPLRAGSRKLADVLERAGQQEPAEYLRALDVDAVDTQIGNTVAKVEDHVRAKPLRTVAMAMLAGFVIGRIVRD